MTQHVRVCISLLQAARDVISVELEDDDDEFGKCPVPSTRCANTDVFVNPSVLTLTFGADGVACVQIVKVMMMRTKNWPGQIAK